MRRSRSGAGDARVVDDDKRHLGDLTADQDYRATTNEELARTSVFRIEIEEVVGKRKQGEADFPGARRYSAQSMVETAPVEDTTT